MQNGRLPKTEETLWGSSPALFPWLVVLFKYSIISFTVVYFKVITLVYFLLHSVQGWAETVKIRGKCKVFQGLFPIVADLKVHLHDIFYLKLFKIFLFLVSNLLRYSTFHPPAYYQYTNRFIALILSIWTVSFRVFSKQAHSKFSWKIHQFLVFSAYIQINSAFSANAPK
jgi:hypothetical protein